jgi:hypothetical protein
MQVKDTGTSSARPTRDARAKERQSARSPKKKIMNVAPPMNAKTVLRMTHHRVSTSTSPIDWPGKPPKAVMNVEATTAAPARPARDRAPRGTQPREILMRA